MHCATSAVVHSSPRRKNSGTPGFQAIDIFQRITGRLQWLVCARLVSASCVDGLDFIGFPREFSILFGGYTQLCGAEECGMIPFLKLGDALFPSGLSAKMKDRRSAARIISDVKTGVDSRFLQWIYRDNPDSKGVWNVVHPRLMNGLHPCPRAVHVLMALVTDPKRRFDRTLVEPYLRLLDGPSYNRDTDQVYNHFLDCWNLD